MNKPDWKDAPKWANWLVQDKDGRWWWHEFKPEIHPSGNWYSSGRDFSLNNRIDFRNSLEERPND